MESSRNPRILICRLSAIGDCLLTLPVICALREAFPAAFLGWVVQEGAAPLLKGHACLDHLVVAKKGWLGSFCEIRRIREELRALRFDTAIDVQSLSKSAIMAWLSGARRRIGFAPPQGRELAPWLDTVRIAPSRKHVVDRYLELLSPLGIDRPTVRFDVPESSDVRGAMTEFLRRAGLRAPFAVVSPGAGWPSKIWPPDRYRALSGHLFDRHRLKTVVVWAGEQERAWGASIVAGLEQHTVLAPRTGLQELVALLKQAALCVAPDTGPLHLAAALGVACVGLYGPTDPAVSGPYGAGHVTVRPSGAVSIKMRSFSSEAIESITVGAVCQACDQALARSE